MSRCKPSQPFANGWRLVSSLGLILLVGCSDSSSVPTPTAKRQTAEQLLHRMRAAYGKAQSYTDHAQYVQQTVRRGEGVQRELPFYQMSLAFRRPNKLRFTFQEAMPSSSLRVSYDIASNGTLIRSASGQVPGQIHETVAPSELTPDNFISEPRLRKEILEVSLENFFPQLAMLLVDNPEQPLFPDDSEAQLLADGELDGNAYHRVQLRGPAGTRVLWIEKNDYSLRRMEIPIEAQRKLLDPHGEFSELSIWIDFLDAAFDADIDADVFELAVPEGARRVRRFVPTPPPGPPATVGKAIGDFRFTTLDGEELSPEKLHGKVAVLDFWFTGCIYCKTYTPVLEEVYQKFKPSEEVAFYAVSTDRSAVPNDVVAKTIRAWGGNMPVLRDSEKTSYKNLGVEKYPTTLLVGSDGRVQLFQMGTHPHSEPLVTSIQKLLDGEDLAALAMAEHEKLLKQYEEELEAATIRE